MRNAPISTLFDDGMLIDSEPGGERSGDYLFVPGGRRAVYAVGLAFFVATCVIFVRLVWVQTQLTERSLAQLNSRTVEYEVIPSRDGRILAEDTVLAADVDEYQIQLHYRWLEEPPDPDWIRHMIRNQLTREERRDPQLTARAEREIRDERERLWRELMQLTGIEADEFRSRRQRIQQRVEAIAESVNRRHARDDETKGSKGASSDSPVDWLLRLASGIRTAVTTTPVRQGDARIVVREEESWHTLVKHAGLPIAAAIQEHPERFPGTRVQRLTERIYPEHNLAAHVVGARTPIAPDASEDASDHAASASGIRDANADVAGTAAMEARGARKGRFGIELYYDAGLRGTPGLRRTVRNRRRQIISEEVVREPETGHDIHLTIDVRLQRLCEQLLAESLKDVPAVLLARTPESERDDPADSGRLPDSATETAQPVPTGGCIVVMEAASGRVLAAASAPGFDLRIFTEGTAAEWTAANDDRRRPFFSRFTGMALPPGSTFKMVSAIAGLQSGTLHAEVPFQCRGYLDSPNEHRCLVFRNFGHGHGSVTLRMALAESCNVYFFDLARRMGIDPLQMCAEQLGFGSPTGIDLPFEKPGTLPRRPQPSRSSRPEPHSSRSGADSTRKQFEREAMGMSIGQSRLTVTPLQMTRMLATIINGGWLVTPHVATSEGRAHRGSGDELTSSVPERTAVPGLTVDVLDQVKEGLIAAVEHPAGTGYRTVRLDHVRIGGKTGTAEAGPGRPDHAWFAGFAPADDPQIVFVVALEHGGSGSHAAGPIAREIVRHLYPEAHLSRTR